MTKPRTSVTREICGILGKVPNASKILKEWNAYFREYGMDATMELYPATIANLPERLSEMYHFDRRFYIVAQSLQKAIIPLLDSVSDDARRRGVTVVMNHQGIFNGDCTSLEELKMENVKWKMIS